MRMNFEVEIFTHNLAFIKIKGIRRGIVANFPTNPPDQKWLGQLEGKKSELKIAGADVNELHFEGVKYKYTDPCKKKPPNVQIFC